MAKKAKKTKTKTKRASDEALRGAEKSAAEKRAELAVGRLLCWLRLQTKLDEIQPDAAEYFEFGPRFTDDEIDAELKRRPHPHGRESAEWSLVHVDRWTLTDRVSKLAQRLHAIGFDVVDERGRTDVAELLRACNDRNFVPEGGSSALVARVLRVVHAVVAVDASLSKGFESVPAPDDRDVLRRLLDKPKTAKEIAKEIAGGKLHLIDDARIERAIRRLRAEHGFELPNVRGVGYFLSPADRARVERMP
jgi:hypothetical protein